jgi:hypothetical protein
MLRPGEDRPMRTNHLLALPAVLALALPAAAQADTVSFTGAGEKLWTVPAGVTSIRADVVGGRGGAGGSALFAGGGFGARVSTNLAVSPGTTLFVEVAANGGHANGNNPGTTSFGGGGLGGAASAGGFGGGAGGGTSDIRLATQANVESRNVRLVVAGGGGGGGGGGSDAGFGGEGGQVATGGTTGAGLGGGAGGAGASTTAAGGNGIFYSGGSGQSGAANVSAGAAGGGGGGYYGGGGGTTGSGGGSRGGGGGAGSSWTLAGVTSATTVATDSTGTPSVTISWTPPAGTPPSTPGTQTPGGGVITGTAPLQTYIDARPRSVIRAKRSRVTVSFDFSSNDDDATFRCKLDDRLSTPCTSGKRYSISRGSHVFRVWAVKDGRRDETPARFSFSLVRKR